MKKTHFAAKTAGILGGLSLIVAVSAQAGDYSSGAIAGGGGALGGGGAGGALGGGGGMAKGVLDEVGGSISVGYDTDYYFRGAHLGRQAPWAGAEVSVPLVEGTDLTVGTWYINPTKGSDNDELDIYASLGFDLGGLDASVGYAAYTYPEAAGGDTNEVGVSVGKSLGGADVSLGAYYDFDLENVYAELGASRSQEIGDGLSVDLSAAIGYNSPDEGDADFSHVLVKAALPIALTDSATLEPYVALNYALDGTEGANPDDEDIFGGVSLSVGF